MSSSGPAEGHKPTKSLPNLGNSYLQNSAAARPLISIVNPDIVLVLASFIAAFALYARTVAPGILDDDGGEFQTNIYRLGVSHTGYPLYFMMAKLWTLVVPIGSIAYRANLFSVLFGALTIALIYVTMRQLVDSRLAAILTAALFAVSRVEWSQSVIPRVYTLNSFFVILLILLAVLWLSGRISLLWVAFAFGLSLTNHRTMIWFAPALALLVLARDGRDVLKPKRFLGLLFAFILPLLLYAYIPIRGDSDVGVEYHAANFADMILAGNASIWLRFGPPGFLWWRFTTAYIPLMLEQFTVVGALFGMIGAIALARGQAPRGFPIAVPPRQVFLFLAGAHIFESAFAIVFWTFDSEKYFIPSYMTFLPFVGIGLALVVPRLEELHLATTIARGLIPLSPVALLIAICLYLGAANFPLNDQSSNDLAETRWQDILSQPIEQNAMIVGNWESLTPLEYYQYVENARRDLEKDKVIIFRDQLSLAPQGDVAGVIFASLSKGQRTYLTLHPAQTETLGALSERFTLVPIASLWRVEDKQQLQQYRQLNARFGDRLVLEAIDETANLKAGDFADTTLIWRLDKPTDVRYKLSLRLRDSAGNLWMQRDIDPFGGLKQTAEWPAQQDIKDAEGFFIPPDAPPGEYNLSIAVYEAESHTAIQADGKPDLPLAKIQISPPDHDFPAEVYHIPHKLDIPIGGGKLLGYELSDPEPQAGNDIELDTWWTGLTDNLPETRIELQDSRGKQTILHQGSAIPNLVGELDPHQIVRAVYSLALPPIASPGPAVLSLLDGGGRIEIARFALSASDRQFIAPQVGHAQAAMLNDEIQFLGYNLKSEEIKPGGNLSVDLYWHVEHPVVSSYKVFVHLLDSDGVLRAQQDSIPHNGTLPTSRWLAGEYVTDQYSVPVPADIRPGKYRIEIGMYSPETGVRAKAFDSAGVRLQDDRVLLDLGINVAK